MPVPPLPQHLADALAATPAGALCVAFSGGPDSLALLHALARLPAARQRGLRALHVDHGLHPDSPAWARHCLALCAGWDVPCDILRVAVARDSGDGLEAAARAARHAALAAAMRPDEILVMAHHRDDQAETFLLRALRASGPDGLAAMRPWRRFGPGWLWRPLLDLPRDTLRDYLAAHSLDAIDDPANRDPRHDRSWLRNELMPLLRQRWPQAGAALARSARLCAETVDLLDSEDSRCLARVQTADPQVLHTDALLALPTARRARVLRRWISELGLPPLPGQAIDTIERELLPARADAEAAFTWSGATIRRWRGLLHAGWCVAPLPDDFIVEWDGRTPMVLPTGDMLRLDCNAQAGAASAVTGAFASDPVAAEAAPTKSTGFDMPVTVRSRRGGERILLPGRDHSHALKHVLQDLGVPPWERERLPLLFAPDGELLAAGDLAVSARLAAWLRDNGLRLQWRRSAKTWTQPPCGTACAHRVEQPHRHRRRPPPVADPPDSL